MMRVILGSFTQRVTTQLGTGPFIGLGFGAKTLRKR